MSGTRTPEQSTPPSNIPQSFDALFQAAISKPGDPRSAESVVSVRAALAYRIESKRISRLYESATVRDEADHAGVIKDNAPWRADRAYAGTMSNELATHTVAVVAKTGGAA